VFSFFTTCTVGFLCIGATGLQLVMLSFNVVVVVVVVVVVGMQGKGIVCLITMKGKTLKVCLN